VGELGDGEHIDQVEEQIHVRDMVAAEPANLEQLGFAVVATGPVMPSGV
jgi:hypothetical protein